MDDVTIYNDIFYLFSGKAGKMRSGMIFPMKTRFTSLKGAKPFSAADSDKSLFRYR